LWSGSNTYHKDPPRVAWKCFQHIDEQKKNACQNLKETVVIWELNCRQLNDFSFSLQISWKLYSELSCL